MIWFTTESGSDPEEVTKNTENRRKVNSPRQFTLISLFYICSFIVTLLEKSSGVHCFEETELQNTGPGSVVVFCGCLDY